MPRDTIDISVIEEQGRRARKLFSAVVLAALDDAVREERRGGDGADMIARWATSRDGQFVMLNAGIDPTDRAVAAMVEYVRRGGRGVAA